MQFDLSSKITLERIPERYYCPEDAIDKIRQTQFEKIDTEIYDDEKQGSKQIAAEIASVIKDKQAQNQTCVLGLSGGSSPLSVYEELVRLHKEEELSFNNVVVFNVTEFYPLSQQNLHNNTVIIKENLLQKVDFNPDNFHTLIPDANEKNIHAFCHAYDKLIAEKGGLDFVLVSVGLIGNLAYNEPGSNIGSKTRLMLLDDQSRADLKPFYNNTSDIPSYAFTIGLSTLMDARQLTLGAWGEHKAAIIKKVVEEKADDNVPASLLQFHKNAKVVMDVNAAQMLTRISHPWLVGSCDWTNKLTRRAIVWLCEKTGKPILKLTNKDYNQHGLDELLVKYGSAYDVNIQIFNDLQHTITGWPGGKPNADDTNRPERAMPYPKRVLVFSPHPDDDVISMGGTFQRLVDQNHEVHVAYQTSGNIAVGDEEVIRYVSLMKSLSSKYNKSKVEVDAKLDEALDALLSQQEIKPSTYKDLLFIKGQIRREEARSACRFVGLRPEHVHFLDLPFYETGAVKKGNLTEKDVLIVMDLIRKVKPHQIFVAGDLADPHGTHKVCLNAALAAIDELKKEGIMDECRVWMYRGAWAEWEIDHIEMAVPISPEQLLNKRKSILRHQSQMESAPFMGNDERLFWQRAEDRNRATASLYQQLGLASYEAIEAFVEYKF
ncbi:Glucosamine-6-phosphate deaminase [bioreactor metagenome]|jgi:glucosamine-6-phosphate deaminase|uniref:Glucosamine-6-phosphate deaminase n=1 Tax=bioreactor metagenome TaxID=1076179 RepID=A0A644VMG3_9ZZZZ|nr:glucosamine-6-phosphate deaminase [Paludibacter sp.]